MDGFEEFARATLRRYGVALAYPDFRTMWLANLSAQAAAWALIVSRGWLVFDMTHSSWMVGLVTFAAMAPLLFMPIVAGVLADRMDRRTLLGSTYFVNMVVTLALGVLAEAGVLNEWWVLALTIVNGMARAAQQSTSQALAASLVPPEKLLNALSLTAATQHMSKLVGPGLVTPVLGYLGAGPAFLVCGLLYGVGWWQIQGIQTASTGGIRKGEPFVESFTAGVRYIWSQPLIRMVLAMVFFHCGLTMAFESLIPNFYAQQLHQATSVVVGAPLPHQHDAPAVAFNTEATGFATLLMGVGLGALIGSVVVGGIESSLARGRLYLVMGVLSGLGQVLFSFAPTVELAFAAAAIMGASQAAFMTMGQALMQALAGNEFRGRVASMNLLVLGGVMSIMNLANGALGTVFPAAAILLVTGLLFVGVMLVSVAFATPRRVYRDGMPSRPPVAAAAG
jgi:MFS family permease